MAGLVPAIHVSLAWK